MDQKTITVAVGFSLVTVLIMSVSLILYVAFHDNLFIPIYNMGDSLETQGVVASGWVTDAPITIFERLPVFLDVMWFLGFLALNIMLVVASYFRKRMSYGQTFSWLIVGIPIILYFSSLVMQLTNFLKTTLLDGVLVNLAPSLTYVTSYLTYHGYYSAALLVACIVANFVDFDFSSFQARKEKEYVEGGVQEI